MSNYAESLVFICILATKSQTMKLFIYPLLLFFVLVNSGLASSQNVYKQLYPLKCDSLIKANSANPNFVILDVRRDSEWRNEHLEGSINRSTGDSDFQQRLALLPKHKIFLLHCQSGGRSAGAFAKMKELEFAEVYEMIGGINGWNSNNLPTTSVLAPKLMLVSQQGTEGENADTIQVTITNRANDLLTFNSIVIDDAHAITHNFNNEISIAGAEDYTFSIYHMPGYSDDDTTQINLDSNGGTLDLKVMVEKDASTGVHEFAGSDFGLYPNPANNRIFVKGIPENIRMDIKVYNLNGQIAFEKTNHFSGEAINVSRINEGVHVLFIETAIATYSQKLFIKH